MLNAEQLGEALRRAFNFGQTYWRQADSDSYKQNALSDKTLNQFNDLVRDTVAAHGVPASDPDRFIGEALRNAKPARSQEDGYRAASGVPASDEVAALRETVATLTQVILERNAEINRLVGRERYGTSGVSEVCPRCGAIEANGESHGVPCIASGVKTVDGSRP